jgi:hypothetical protein
VAVRGATASTGIQGGRLFSGDHTNPGRVRSPGHIRTGTVMSRPGLHSDWGERLRRAAVVRAWIAEYGYWCPGYLVRAHGSGDLTADHLDPVGAGGREDGPLSVLCRGCNSRKQDGRRTRSSVVRSRSW